MNSQACGLIQENEVIRLGESAYRRARTFLATDARRLEWRLFEFHFEHGARSAARVIEELARFQNPDGGFGRALEPDVRMEDSSVVATKFALQVLIDIQAPADEPLVRQGLAYLHSAYDIERGVWPLVTREVMTAPHAPWWDAQGLEEEFGSYLANPKAGVLRCLLEYSEQASRELIDSVTRTVMEHLDALPVEMSLFDAVSYLLLAQAGDLGDKHRAKLVSKLRKTGSALVSRNPDEWTGFSIKPLWLSPSPSAPLATVLAQVVQTNLDFEIDNQDSDGSWAPTWSWGDSYPESWKVAEREWRGILTLATLRSLRDYDRIEGCPPVLSGFKYHID